MDAVTIFDVAKYILNQMGKVGTWKLQKLCFYAQAWHLAWTDTPLFYEDFQAWANGPVCKELFDEHKGKYTVEEKDIHRGNKNNLDPGQTETVEIIMRDYGSMQPWELRELTHQEDPWKITRGNLPEGASSNNIIPKELMAEYYGSL